MEASKFTMIHHEVYPNNKKNTFLKRANTLSLSSCTASFTMRNSSFLYFYDPIIVFTQIFASILMANVAAAHSHIHSLGFFSSFSKLKFFSFDNRARNDVIVHERNRRMNSAKYCVYYVPRRMKLKY